MPLPSRVGRYEIKSRIGGGGMGTLYLARDTNPTTDRLVALKLLSANLEHGDLRTRFLREARSLSALSHPNIVVIHDSGEFQGAPFIVMEYVRGESLAEKIRRRAPMSLTQKMRLMAELCEGLAHAHAAGIIHRDIKPANLMVDQHGRLKVLDFGIAREGDGRQTQYGAPLTRLHTSIGTPGYMSPEQIEGVEIDHRTDLFSAGTVCYELLAYREAFAGATTRQIEKRVMHDDPPPLSTVVQGLDPAIEEIVALALSKDVADRAQSAGELLDAIQRVRERLAPESPPTRVTPPQPIDPSGSRDSRRKRLAEAAYHRALASRADGALDFARRSAHEALAEDPDHAAARVLLGDLGGEVDTVLVESTVLATEHQPEHTPFQETVIEHAGFGSRKPSAPLPWRPDQRPWIRYAPLAGSVAVGLVVLGGGWAYRDRWMPSGGTPATVAAAATPTPVNPTGAPPEEAVPTTLIAKLEDPQGVPVNDADVRLSPGNVVAGSNGFGEYLFGSVMPGPYTLTARHREFKERAVTITVAAGGVQQVVVLDRSASTVSTIPRIVSTPKEPLPPYRPSEPQHTSTTPPQAPLTPTPPQKPPTISTALAQDTLERAIKALNDDGDIDRAERLLAEAQRLDPNLSEVGRELARVGEIRAAERRQKIREHVLRAQRMFRELGDLDGALREVDSALKIHPSDPQAVGLREEILRVKAIGTKKPPPQVMGSPGIRHERTSMDTEHR